MSLLNFKFQAKHGNAMIAKDDIICMEDVDDYTCALTIRLPNNEIHKIYSVERADVLYDRVLDIKSIAPIFVERRRTIESISNDDEVTKKTKKTKVKASK